MKSLLADVVTDSDVITVIQEKIDEKGRQVKTGYTINKPVTGDLTSLVTLVKWQESGFKVDSNTYLQVLAATSENETGDGKSTCTLQQKGDNYSQIEKSKCGDVDGNGVINLFDVTIVLNHINNIINKSKINITILTFSTYQLAKRVLSFFLAFLFFDSMQHNFMLFEIGSILIIIKYEVDKILHGKLISDVIHSGS